MQDLLEAAADQTFIRVAEVWTPGGDGLRLTEGSLGELLAFTVVSQETASAKGQALLGHALAEQRKVVLNSLDGGGFLRSGEAAAG